MSSFLAYFNDERIALTTIYARNEGETYEGEYGDDALQKTGFSGSLRFTAEPADGYEFRRWVYRVGADKESSATATVQYSTSNPFTYSGGEFITIRAEGTEGGSGGGGGDDEWSLHSYSRGKITAGIYIERDMKEMDLCRASCSFAVSGTVKFYSLSSVDPAGYITTTTDWDEYLGTPILEDDDDWDDDSGPGYDFYLEYEVEANKTYYFWWSLFGAEEGPVTVYIIPPGGSIVPEGGGGLYVHDGSGWVRCVPYIHDGTGWTRATPCIHDGAQWIQGEE